MTELLSEFVSTRRDGWDRLDALVQRAGGRVHRLTPAEVRELGAGYRRLVADLAYARRRFVADPVTARLETLARDARPLVYGSVTERESVAHFATTGFWRRVAERPVFLVVSALLLFAPMGALALWAHGHPEEAARVAQVSDLSAGVGEGEGGGMRDPDTDKVTETGTNAGFSAAIFTNNARVALVAYAGGLTGGAITVVSLVFNGLLVGLIAGLAVQAGSGEAFWRLVVPHGVLELSLIVVAGAAGLRTGWALVHPGHRTRVEALAVEGRAGVEMALGAALLLVPTGLVEGFVTPRGLSLWSALAVGVALGAVFWALVWWRGRPAPASG
ncbi:MAG TPA: stage II sporulation protein M [Acidimicrobiales bacterium]|nr:stage II sporulation protein M [Acidimicrobiales bacterium]HMS87571.1 stage II sporulation protein M [Acidimicrobiales bacterium]HRA33743.1 stage II sporulation protein M [Acidimicrobiales bacterium]